MAKTTYTTSSNETVKWWSAKTFAYGEFNNYFNKYVGEKVTNLAGVKIETSDNALIITKHDFKKGKGDEVTFSLIDPFVGDGVIDDETMEDQEEALVSHDFKIRLRRRRHATRTAGKMTERMVAWSIRAKSKTNLGLWLARVHDRDIVAAMSGVANSVGTIAANAPSSTRKWTGGQKADGTLYHTDNDLDSEVDSQTNHLFGEKVIEAVRRKATMTEPILRPIRTKDGEDIYLMFIHGYQHKALRAATDYKAALQDADVRGAKNRLFRNSAGFWNGVLVHEIPKIETRLGAGGSTASEYFDSGDDCASGIAVARALFCGAGAVCVAYGGNPEWDEEDFDYGNQWGICLSLFLSIAKTEFNSIDYGVIAVDTAYVAD